MVAPSADAFNNFLIEFGRFRDENQKQHGELATAIANNETAIAKNETAIAQAETRLIKWIVGGFGTLAVLMIGGFAIAVNILLSAME